jgi:nucleoside-diphosphate-sugar epimerase
MNIAVIGCGYIGGLVAKIWKNRGFHVTGTTRHAERLKEVTQVAQKGVLLKASDKEGLETLIADNDVILVAIGADRPEDYDSAYRQTAQIFHDLALEIDQPKRLIYTSSASVYGDHNGMHVKESSSLLTETELGKILVETEHLYQSLTKLGWHVCIFRLAEIYGPGRELSKRIQKSTPFPGTGTQFTNMIHSDDTASAIDFALRHHLEGIFNLSDDDHPTRKELFNAVADKHHLPHPHWDPHLATPHYGNKKVSNNKIKSEGFVFKHPHRELD